MALVTNNISGSAQGSSRIGITGSVVIGDATDLAFPVAGSDVSFFVSGSNDKRSVFGGALVISGALHVEGNSYIGNSAADTLMVSGSSSTFVSDVIVSGSLIATSGTTILGDDFEITGTFGVSGSSTFSGGSVTIFGPEGLSIDGANLDVTGSATVSGNLTVSNNTVISGTLKIYGDAPGNLLVAGADGEVTDTNLLVLDSIGTRLRVTGTVDAMTGFSGSLTTLTDGTSYLIAGSNVTITSASNGAVTISASGGGGGGSSYFDSTTSGSLYTTGSVAFRGDEVVDSPADKGADVFFYVSGSTNGDSKSLFGGDLVVSGSLTAAVGTTILGDSFEITGTFGVSGSSSFSGDVNVTGSVRATSGLSGSLTTLVDGTSYIIAGTNVTVTSASNGAVTISASGGGGGSYFDSTTSGSIYTTGSVAIRGDEAIDSPADKGADVFFYVSGSTSGDSKSLFGGDLVVSGALVISGDTLEVTGTVAATQGLSGSLTKLSDGTSYIIAGSNVTVTSASNGAVTISATGGGGGASYFDSTTDGALFTTGSLALIGADVGIDSPADKGADVFFYVSGSLDGLNKSVLGGDAVVSGSLQSFLGLSGSLTQLSDGTSYLIAGSNVTITSASNGAVTISSTGGGGGGASYFDSTTAGSVFSTGSLALVSAEAGVDSPSDKGADVFFYVSGSSGTNSVNPYVSLFGGDVVVSGSRLVNVVSGTGGGSAYTVSLSDHLVVFTSNNVTASLPSAARVGTSIVFKDGTGAAGGASGPQMISSSAGRIDGSATFTMPNINYTSVTCVKVNTSPEHWVVI